MFEPKHKQCMRSVTLSDSQQVELLFVNWGTFILMLDLLKNELFK